MKQTTLDDYKQRILKAELLIENQLDEQLAPVVLSKAASFSLHHFHRIFRGLKGESIMQYVRRLRLERSAKEIVRTKKRILEVALEAGYDSNEAFSRAFKEHFGVLPSNYRQQEGTLRAQQKIQRLPLLPYTKVRIQDLPTIEVYGMRNYGSYKTVGATFEKLLHWVQIKGFPHPLQLYGICPDDPEITDEALLRFDACVKQDKITTPDHPQEVFRKEITAGTYAIGLHRGPYETLHETYLDVIGRWLPQSGYDATPDPVVEHYLDDPKSTPKESLRTEIWVKLAES